MLDELEFKKLLAEKIKALRYKKNLKTEGLAYFSDMDARSINVIENGKVHPRSYTLYKILYSLDENIFETLFLNPNNNQELVSVINRKIKNLSHDSLEAINFMIDNVDFSVKKK